MFNIQGENLTQALKIAPPAIFLIILVIFIVLSFILNYHWTRYGVLPESVKKVRWIYFGVSAILFGAMIISYLTLV